VHLRLLGPVTVVTAEETLDIPVQKHRAVLAALALRSPGIATTSELIDALWADDPPTSADKTLQGYVAALRKAFGNNLIRTVPGGYQVGPGVDQIDTHELEALVHAAQRDLELGNPTAARRSFTAALALWRGRPLADLAPGPARDGQLARLDELRLLAAEGLVVAELQVGHHRDVVPDLERLVAEYPYRELLWQSLMLALYRSGRAAEALAAYQRLRTTLREELGIQPSEATRALEAQILVQDHQLDLPAPTPPNNLRLPLDSFVDRAEERQEVLTLVDGHRLVTLLGVGGVGKSRLAQEIGAALLERMPGGVWWIDLASIPATGSVLGQVIAAMELSTPITSTPETVLLARLRRSPSMLLLDNCEHVRDAVASFVEWVTSGVPSVRLLATSRVTLDLPGEQLVVIEPLDVSPIGDQSVSDASRLFLDRASERTDMGSVETADVEAITDLVGGLPLGIELAAAQCAVKTPRQLSGMLCDRDALLSLSGRDRDDLRHASLGHVLATSVDALEPGVAAFLPRLAVCPGDFDVATASAVFGMSPDDAERAMSSLLDASLLVRAPSDARRRRFRILRPVREYLWGRLAERDRQQSEADHARHFQEVARRYIDDAGTPAEAIWSDYIRLEEHNVRTALAWFERHDPRGALAFGPVLGFAWMNFGDQIEGRQTLRRLLAAEPDAPSRLVAWTEESLTWLELLSGDVEAALAHNLDAIRRFEQLGDDRGRSRALRSQAHAFFLSGADEAATTPTYQRSIQVAGEAGFDYARALGEVTFAHALTSWEALDVVDVEAMLTHAASVLRHYGDHANLAHAALGRALLAFGRADHAGTQAAGEEMLRESRLGSNLIWELGGLTVLGVAAHEAGDQPQSRKYLREAVHLALDSANAAQLGIALHAVAATAAARDPVAAARIWGAAGGLTPLWPLFDRRYGEWMKPARDTLGQRFDELVADGAHLSLEAAAALANETL
jgi:DNA-binding SARP family transcriptional activator/predicted ATPase